MTWSVMAPRSTPALAEVLEAGSDGQLVVKYVSDGFIDRVDRDSIMTADSLSAIASLLNPRATCFKLRIRTLGEHVHVTIFAGPMASDKPLPGSSLGNAGRLVFRLSEWEAFAQLLVMGTTLRQSHRVEIEREDEPNDV